MRINVTQHSTDLRYNRAMINRALPPQAQIPPAAVPVLIPVSEPGLLGVFEVYWPVPARDQWVTVSVSGELTYIDDLGGTEPYVS